MHDDTEPNVPASHPAAAQAEAPWILLAEDDLELAALLMDVMVTDGYRVRAVSDGPQLLRALSDGRTYEAVISDVRMPRLSGIDVLAVTAGDPRPPVILMTAFPGEALIQVAHDLGAVAVLPKPFALDALRELLRCVVSRSVPPLALASTSEGVGRPG